MGGIVITMLLMSFFIKRPTILATSVNGSFFIKEDTFEIGWIHSVEKEPWFELFERKGNDLYLIGTRFKTFGAGTPSDEQVIASDDGFVHMKVNLKMKELRLTISEDVKTTLYRGADVIPLYKRIGNHETIVFEVKKIPLWQLLLQRGGYGWKQVN